MKELIVSCLAVVLGLILGGFNDLLRDIKRYSKRRKYIKELRVYKKKSKELAIMIIYALDTEHTVNFAIKT